MNELWVIAFVIVPAVAIAAACETVFFFEWQDRRRDPEPAE